MVLNRQSLDLDSDFPSKDPSHFLLPVFPPSSVGTGPPLAPPEPEAEVESGGPRAALRVVFLAVFATCLENLAVALNV